MQEIWKDIEWYKGFYQVSDLGRVRSLNRYVNNGDKMQFIKGKILSQWDNGKGYKVVTFRVSEKERKNKNFYVHRLVAENFIDNPGKLNVVNHKDFDKSNNKVENLEWCNTKYNIHYSISKGRYDYKTISKNKVERNIDLEQKMKRPIIRDYEKGLSVTKLTLKYNLGYKRINRILDISDIKRRSNSTCVKILQFQNGKKINTFCSVNEAARWLLNNGYTNSKYADEPIGECLNGKRLKKEVYGFYWKKELIS